MDYNGTSVTINVDGEPLKQKDQAYEFSNTLGALDGKLAFITAARAFCVSEKFSTLSHSLYATFKLNVGLAVHTAMPENSKRDEFVNRKVVTRTGHEYIVLSRRYAAFDTLFLVYKCVNGQDTIDVKASNVFLIGQVSSNGESEWLFDELRSSRQVKFKDIEEIEAMYIIMKHCHESIGVKIDPIG